MSGDDLYALGRIRSFRSATDCDNDVQRQTISNSVKFAAVI